MSVITDSDTKCAVMDRAAFERLMGPLQEMFHDAVSPHLRIGQCEDVEKLHQQSIPYH